MELLAVRSYADTIFPPRANDSSSTLAGYCVIVRWSLSSAHARAPRFRFLNFLFLRSVRAFHRDSAITNEVDYSETASRRAITLVGGKEERAAEAKQTLVIADLAEPGVCQCGPRAPVNSNRELEHLCRHIVGTRFGCWRPVSRRLDGLVALTGFRGRDILSGTPENVLS